MQEQQVAPNNIINTDQTGVKLEMITGRSLAFKGESRVKAVIQRQNALQHSFTIQPAVTMDGTILSPTLVVFNIPGMKKEANGEYKKPRNFAQEMNQFDNIFADATLSGLCTSYIEIRWFKELLLPKTEAGSVLILDSWGGFDKAMADPLVTQHLKIEVIPPKATKYIQPLDLYFNRPLKQLIRVICDKVRMGYNQEFTIGVRENLGKLVSLVLYQVTAERFRDMIRYAWFRGGYTDQRPPAFVTPASVCTNFPPAARCSVANCIERGFLKCAHCENVLCISHILINQHRC